MSSLRRILAPQLMDPSTANEFNYDDSALEGVASNVKLLLKLIQDHKDACHKEKKDGRRMLRVATMMTILENVRSRIQKCQAFGLKGSEEAELRRCLADFNTPVNHHHQAVDDENAKLKKELSASLSARKNLEVMCSSLGREKEIIASELTRKVHLLNESEELISDLKAQNESLLEKLQEERRRNSGGGESTRGNLALQEKNKTLSEQLLRSLDGYRSMKRRYKEAREESILMHSAMEEMGMKVRSGLDHIRDFKEKTAPDSEVQEEMASLEHVLESLELQVSKHELKKGEINNFQPRGVV